MAGTETVARPALIRGLAELTAPVDPAEFLSGYWGRRPLHVQARDAERFRGLMTLDDMDRILAVSSLRESDLHVVTAGRRHRFEDEDEDVGTEAVYALYRQGATVAVNFLHRRWEPLALLCAQLSRELSALPQTNAYLTPAGAQGFAPHYDTHDVFVAQIHGVKRWRLYETSKTLPEPAEPWAAPDGWAEEPVAEFELRPGDLLYLPRGTPHSAATQDSSSLHLTIGVTPITWASVVRDAVNRVIGEHAEYREALPPGFADSAHGRADRVAHARELVARLTGLVDPEASMTELGRSTAAAGAGPASGRLRDLEAVRAIDLDTPVRRRDGMRPWGLVGDGAGSILLRTGETSLRLPERLGPDLEFAAAGAGFTGRALPGPLDGRGRVVLVRRLVEEGFLTVIRTTNEDEG